MSLPYTAECVGAILFSVVWVHAASYFFVRRLNLTMPEDTATQDVTVAVHNLIVTVLVTMHGTIDKLLCGQAAKP